MDERGWREPARDIGRMGDEDAANAAGAASSAGDALLAAWAAVPAVDHHCHLLRRGSAALEPHEFRACFTEATDPRALAEHAVNTPLYRLLLRRLAPVFGCQPTEAAILTARRMLEPARYARELLERSGTGLMLVDTGFGGGDALTLAEQQAIVPIPQREIVRLETLAEGLVGSCRRPEDWLDAVRRTLAAAVARGAVAVKTIVAYRASLRVRWPDHQEVRAAYAALRRAASGPGRSGRPRLTGDPLCHTLVLVAAEECARLRVPMQVHCGIGDADEDIGESSPAGLRPLLVDERFADLQLVLLHCYPFHREAAYLCSVHAGAYMDLSLAVWLAASDGARAMREVLGLCPWTKLLYATDASRLPEVYLVAAELHRDALADGFGDLVARQLLTLEEAQDAGRQVLAGNALRLYRL
ncbi:MAG TPA: amidohydrolase family protein [Candidatus Eisenbacteria bacterium]|nr:amidohydrolase family protein [Candidatus Eisenbacteria bacterium]